MRASRTYVKVCGMTRPEDAEAAAAAGVDALGVVMAASPRQVSVKQALEVFDAAGEGVARAAVFVDQRFETVDVMCGRLRLDWAQLSGGEPPDYCLALPLPVVKAVHVGGRADVEAAVEAYEGPAVGLLLDSRVPGMAGGTGVAFDWAAVAPLPEGIRCMVAGGLTPGNVGEAIRVLRPWAVDVSSGVESAPGVKDPALMEAFVAAVRAADEEVAR